MGRIIAYLLILSLTLASCKKEEVNPNDPDKTPTGLELWEPYDLTSGSVINDCDAFIEKYTSHILDFAILYDNRVGSVEFQSDGTCVNHWSGDDTFISWKYHETGLPGNYTTWCNAYVVRMRNAETGLIDERLIHFKEFADSQVIATVPEVLNGRIIFYPR